MPENHNSISSIVLDTIKAAAPEATIGFWGLTVKKAYDVVTGYKDIKSVLVLQNEVNAEQLAGMSYRDIMYRAGRSDSAANGLHISYIRNWKHFNRGLLLSAACTLLVLSPYIKNAWSSLQSRHNEQSVDK